MLSTINQPLELAGWEPETLFSSFIPRLAIPAVFHHIGRSKNPGHLH